ncbi:MAG: c-type cytochrome [Nitrospinales bacterium]
MKILSATFVFLCLFWINQDIAVPNEVAELNAGASSVLEKGQSLFLRYCSHCHGLQGKGDGYNAEFLEKEPAELSDPKFMAKKQDDQIFRVIQSGGIGVRKSHLMPVFGYTLTEEDIWSLVAYVRSLSGNNSPVHIPKQVNHSTLGVAHATPKEIEGFSQWFSRGQEQGLIDQGEKLFRKKKSCLACHQVVASGNNDDEEEEEGEEVEEEGTAEGGRVGPNLLRAGFLYPPEWLYVWLKNPQDIKPKTKMPNLGLDDGEEKAIIAYLASLKGGVEETPVEWLPYLAISGDAQNGERLFFDEKTQAGCVRCHTVNNKGGTEGPDLSFIGAARTLPFLLESILDPNKVIATGFAKVALLFKGKYEGKITLTGTRVNEDESSIDLIDKNGRAHHISKDRIRRVFKKPSPMAQGNFRKKLTVEEIRDILAFLKTLKPEVMAGLN